MAQREVVVAGTYHTVPASPVGPFDALVAIPKGMADASSIIFYVFLVGGAFAVVERTGALAQLVNWLAHRLAGRGLWVIPIVGFAFAWGGILIQMQEELIAFVPVLLLLVRRLGFNALIRGGDQSRRGRRGCGVQSDQPLPGGDRPEGGRPRAPEWLGAALGGARVGMAHLDRWHNALRATISRPPEAAEATGTPIAGGRQAASSASCS